MQLRDSDFLEAKEDLGRLTAVQLLACNVNQQKRDGGTTHFECIQNWPIGMETGLSWFVKLLA